MVADRITPDPEDAHLSTVVEELLEHCERRGLDEEGAAFALLLACGSLYKDPDLLPPRAEKLAAWLKENK